MDILARPARNPLIVLREETDDWGLLFNPDTGETFGLDPTGIFLWKLSDGSLSIDDMCQQVREGFRGVPEGVAEMVVKFFTDLQARNLISSKGQPPGK